MKIDIRNIPEHSDVRAMLIKERRELAQIKQNFIDQVIDQFAKKGDSIKLKRTSLGRVLIVNNEVMGLFISAKNDLVFRTKF